MIEWLLIIAFIGLLGGAAGLWYWRSRKKAGKKFEVDFFTLDGKLITEVLAVDSMFVVDKESQEAYFLDPDAIRLDENNEPRLVCTSASAIPHYPGIAIDRAEKARQFKAVLAAIARGARDRAFASSEKKAQGNKFSDMVQLLVLGSFALIALLMVIWLFTSDVEISMPSFGW